MYPRWRVCNFYFYWASFMSAANTLGKTLGMGFWEEQNRTLGRNCMERMESNMANKLNRGDSISKSSEAVWKM